MLALRWTGLWLSFLLRLLRLSLGWPTLWLSFFLSLLQLSLRRSTLRLSSLLLHLLLMSLDLGHLSRPLLSLTSQFLSLRLRPRLIALNAPSPLSFPISIVIPVPPVMLKSSLGDPLIVPPVSVPITVPVVSSPTRVYIVIKSWDISVIGPPPVIISGAIPTSFPKAPPPTVPEIEIHINIRNNIHIGRIGEHDHFRRCLKYNGWRQGNSDTYIHPCRCRDRNGECQRQKDCSQQQFFHAVTSLGHPSS